jgi:pimeloyl-ACP methyl ester carboxylesterase
MLSRRGAIAVTLAVVTLTAGAGTAAAEGGTDPNCRQQYIAVSLSPGQPASVPISGWLCWRGSLEGKTVQLLQHGATYDHNYWDWPGRPYTNSYVWTATLADYATFTIDRLGVGLSSHPTNPDDVSVTSESFVTHQLVTALRSGDVGGTRFGKVISVGFSLGSAIAMVEASTYGDVDGLILTGILHVQSAGLATFLASIYPAAQDPKFAGSGLAPGYITTMPGTRGMLFYNVSNAAGAVVRGDEELKQTATIAEAISFANALDPSVSLGLHVPVLVVIGQKDFLFCDESAGLSCMDTAAIRSREAGLYPPQACLEISVQRDTGHSLALHFNATQSFAVMLQWSTRRAGSRPTGPVQRCP